MGGQRGDKSPHVLSGGYAHGPKGQSRRDKVRVARHDVPGYRCKASVPTGEVWWIRAENPAFIGL
jgi:hypothetical protein